jgi:hypothetical protein
VWEEEVELQKEKEEVVGTQVKEDSEYFEHSDYSDYSDHSHSRGHHKRCRTVHWKGCCVHIYYNKA